MKKTFLYVIAMVGIVAQSPNVLAEVTPDKLTKVTSETNAKCVEYYQYKGALYCSTEALSTKPLDADVAKYDKAIIQFDNRMWKLAWGKKTDKITTVEYVPNGDDINHWNELITSQFFPGLQNKVTPKEFADFMIDQLKEGGYSPIVTFIKTTPEKVIFEFRIESPANQIQDELQMVTKGKDGLYVLHYVIKKKDMGNVNRDLWVNNLSQSKISAE